jgi:hypothetical protein
MEIYKPNLVYHSLGTKQLQQIARKEPLSLNRKILQIIVHCKIRYCCISVRLTSHFLYFRRHYALPSEESPWLPLLPR